MLGGGILGAGCVQEEIRLMISPESLVSLLITETLMDHEAISIIGTERYNNYKGYSYTFKYDGSFRD